MSQEPNQKETETLIEAFHAAFEPKCPLCDRLLSSTNDKKYKICDSCRFFEQYYEEMESFRANEENEDDL